MRTLVNRIGVVVGVWTILLSAGDRPALAQTVVNVGAGTYYGQTPAGQEVPVDAAGTPVTPIVTGTFSQVPQANKWWSSLIWKRYADNPFGFSMYPHPLAVRAYTDGLDVGYIQNTGVYAAGYGFDLNPTTTGLRLGVEGLTAPEVRVDSYGDWTVTASWVGAGTSAGKSMQATFGHGLPFVYATISGGPAKVKFNTTAGTPVVWANRGNVIGVTVGPSSYALFAPTGSTWTLTSTTATSTLNGQSYFSVATLPAATNAALDLFVPHAFAFVTDSRVSWNYNRAASTVDATFTLTTVAKDGVQTTPLTALYRHQWLNSTQTMTAYSYASPRGAMKLAATSAFTVKFPFRGIIPTLPDVGAVPAAELSSLVDQSIASGLGGGNDTYGAGKTYGRLSQLVHLAQQSGNTTARDRMIAHLKSEIGEWFSVGAAGGGRSAYSAIEAESFDYTSPPGTIQTLGSRVAVTGLANGSVLGFRNVDFGASQPTRLLLTFASGTPGSGLVEIHLDTPTGPVIAGGGIGSTGSIANWVEGAFGYDSAAVPGLQGVHDIYFSVTTPYSGERLRLDSLRFDRAGAPANRFFAYNQPWHTLLGYPGSFGSTTELNDHHFHYGYFIMAAATLAQFDPAWATQGQYGAFVKLLIADVANTDRASTMFPFLRNYDVYAGHGLASGHAAAAAGNNQESSSESINFSAGVALWGAATGDTQLRDLGIFLYASEAAAIQQYWFDADHAVFPAGNTHPLAGIVWNNGAVYATFFSGDPDLIQGINLLPVSSASLHLGLRPDSMNANYQHLVQQTGGAGPNDWQDINWSGLALGNPASAAQLLASHPAYAQEAGDSIARTNHWIRSLATLGTVDASVTADTPHYAVFVKAGQRSYMAWNPTAQSTLVTFSDGFTLCAAPRSTTFRAAASGPTTCSCPSDFNGDGFVTGEDFDAYVAAFELGTAAADFDGDGFVTGEDFDAFVAAFGAGC